MERELRANGFLRPGIDVDLDALHAFLAPMAEPSKVESFKFTREWLRGEAARVTDLRASNITRKFNLPPSYVLIHRVSTAGIGVLCQLECEGEFRAEVLKWIPGYLDEPAALEAGDGPGRRAARPARRRGADSGESVRAGRAGAGHDRHGGAAAPGRHLPQPGGIPALRGRGTPFCWCCPRRRGPSGTSATPPRPVGPASTC